MATFHGSSCSSDELAEIFRHHFELLVNATAPVHRAIACRLYTAGWISKPTKNDATSTGISPELAAMQVVNDLETNLTTKLRSDPDPGGVIVELCRCLERETNYKTIVQSIRRELSLQGGVGGSLEEKRENTPKEGERCQEKKEKKEDEDVKGQTKWEENKEKVRLVLQKDREMDQLKLALQNKEHELSEMQKALDKLQHQPIPEPRAPAADLQIVKNLQDQLSLIQRQLEEAVEEVTEARNTHKIDTIVIEELRAKLNEVTTSNRIEIDLLNTEIYEFKAKNGKLLTELDAAKSKVHELEINNRELMTVSQVKTFTQRHTAAFNLDSVIYELQRAKFPVVYWEPLSRHLNTWYCLHTSFASDDAEKLHGMIESWVNSTKDSNPWITLVSAVDRIGEHDVAAKLATAVFGVRLQEFALRTTPNSVVGLSQPWEKENNKEPCHSFSVCHPVQELQEKQPIPVPQHNYKENWLYTHGASPSSAPQPQPFEACPLCGQSDFATQSDLEIHCANCNL